MTERKNRQGGVYLIKRFDKPKPPNYDNIQTTHELGQTKRFIDMMQKYTKKQSPKPKGKDKEEEEEEEEKKNYEGRDKCESLEEMDCKMSNFFSVESLR